MSTKKVIALILIISQLSCYIYTMEMVVEETAADVCRRCQELLRAEQAIATQAHHNQQALMPAIQSGNIEKVKELIALKINPNAICCYNNTPLQFAARFNFPEIIVLLLQAGANPKIGELNQKSPLMIAIHDGGLKTVLVLLQAGVDINIKDSFNNTPLIIAANLKLTDIAKALIDAGANVNNIGGDRRSALYHAVSNGNLPLVQYLIEHGADATIKDIYNKTPLDIANENTKKFLLHCIETKRERDKQSQVLQKMHI